MSTPVSVEPPPRAHLRTDSEQERDLQVKLQKMISLQYQEQHLSERDNNNSGLRTISRGNTGGEPQQRSIGLMRRSTAADTLDLNATASAGRESAGGDDGAAISRTTTPRNTTTGAGLPPPSPQSGVGRGTLYFPNTYQAGFGAHNSPRQLASVTARDHLQLNQPLPPQQIYTGYGSVPDQEHDFRYGNPDYHDPYDAADQNESSRKAKSCCEKICCLYRPIVNLLSQEHLHRSFCYGAIDGMLTGSGIASAFCALDVLSVHTKWEVRLAVVVFTAAACTADSICMAIGHVWTSFVVSSGHAQERSKERRLLNVNKADAKIKLVEMLLSRGMLKIDAMSLADTLEGYPDMFVSVLVGDSLLAGPEEPDDAESTPGNSMGGGFGSWKFPTYGQFNEIDHDPEAGNVNYVIEASRNEGVFMMIGFAVFAVIPSLLWLFLPLWVSPPPSSSSAGTFHGQPSNAGGQTISLSSVVVSITAIIMWFLGVWKSKFLDSNWAMFGIETVVVLLICVMSAYGVGLALAYALGGGAGGVVLTNTRI